MWHTFYGVQLLCKEESKYMVHYKNVVIVKCLDGRLPLSAPCTFGAPFCTGLNVNL